MFFFFLAIAVTRFWGSSEPSAVVDERMHIYSMMAQPINSRESRTSTMGVAET